MESIIIRNIAFGKDQAEKEKNLQENFISTSAYLIGGNLKTKKTFYVGNRGSGKSALFQQLLYDFNDKGNITLELKASNYGYESFRRMEHDFYDIRSTYTSAWEYTLYIEMFNSVVRFFNEKRESKKNKENYDTIKKYLVDNNFIENDEPLSVFISFLKQSIDAHKESRSIKTQEASQFISMVKKKAMTHPLKCLRQISQTHPIFLFVDELDTGWDNSIESKNFINGLLCAIDNIENERDLQCNIYVSIRKDMYNNLAGVYLDTEKMRSNVEYIQWNKKLLRSIIAKRIATSIGKDYAEFPDDKSLLDLVFEGNALDYMIENTLYRPREIIQFCNACRDILMRYHPNELSKKISIDIVKEAQKKYATDRFNDFCSEYKDEFPGINDLLIKFGLRKYIYPMSEFCEIIEDLLFGLWDQQKETWVNNAIDNPKKFIETLFDIGFIKIYSPQDGAYLPSYEYYSVINWDNISSISINNIFSYALNCTE